MYLLYDSSQELSGVRDGTSMAIWTGFTDDMWNLSEFGHDLGLLAPSKNKKSVSQ